MGGWDALAKLRRATIAKAKADEAWRKAIREAVQEHHSIRAVGEAAGVSHVRVLQLTRD